MRRGWRSESERHSLAARGVKTGIHKLYHQDLLAQGISYVRIVSKFPKGYLDVDATVTKEQALSVASKYKPEYHPVIVKEKTSILGGKNLPFIGRTYNYIVAIENKHKIFANPLLAKGDEPWWKLAVSEDYFNRGMDLMHAAPIRHESQEQRHEDLVKAERLLSRTGIPLKVESTVMSGLQDEATKYRMKGFTSSEARTMAEADRVKKFRGLVRRVKIVND
jgi:hypothetical protein